MPRAAAKKADSKPFFWYNGVAGQTHLSLKVYHTTHCFGVKMRHVFMMKLSKMYKMK